MSDDALLKIVSDINFFLDELNSLNEFLDFSYKDEVILFDLMFKLDCLENKISKFEVDLFFSDENDKKNVFLDIKAGAGGVDAQDWVDMLFKMYMNWAHSKKFKVLVNSLVSGDVAGIKNISLNIIGYCSYGLLKYETGVHRLVRKSPFSSSSKRHTSFASVYVYPDISFNNKIIINDNDLKIETFKSGGAGGQHVNKTESAVRITHLPTGTIVQSQSDRSQHKNKSNAYRQLESKLNDFILEKEKKEKKLINKNKIDISWGNQIRSYILDRSIIKDLRTNLQVSNVKLVLDGNIDIFIFSMLGKKL